MATSFFDTITIQDFKSYFSIRKSFQFNTYPLYNINTTYNQNDIVYSNIFDVYESQEDNNAGNSLNDINFWLILDKPFLVFDEFITEAFTQAKSTIAFSFGKLQDTDNRKKQGFLLLAGHYLKLLLNERAGIPSNNAYTSGGFIASESANGVSLSYTRPEQFSTFDTFLASTEFGIQYSAILKQIYSPSPINVNPRNRYSTSKY